MKPSIKDILSVLKNDGRFQGNQKAYAKICAAIEKVDIKSYASLSEAATAVKNVI